MLSLSIFFLSSNICLIFSLASKWKSMYLLYIVLYCSMHHIHSTGNSVTSCVCIFQFQFGKSWMTRKILMRALKPRAHGRKCCDRILGFLNHSKRKFSFSSRFSQFIRWLRVHLNWRFFFNYIRFIYNFNAYFVNKEWSLVNYA